MINMRICLVKKIIGAIEPNNSESVRKINYVCMFQYFGTSLTHLNVQIGLSLLTLIEPLSLLTLIEPLIKRSKL